MDLEGPGQDNTADEDDGDTGHLRDHMAVEDYGIAIHRRDRM